MGKIFIGGLGPGSPDLLTRKAENIIRSGCPQYVRTEDHEAISFFQEEHIPYTSFDEIYREKSSFEEVYRTIADILLHRSQDEDIAYWVPGHPLVAEKTVKLLLEEKAETVIIDGLSFMEPVFSLLEKDPVDGLLFLNGEDLHITDLSPRRNLLITQIYNRRILSEVKLLLGEVYGEQGEVHLVISAGTERETGLTVKIEDLDREPTASMVKHETCLYVGREEQQGKNDLSRLVKVVETLRSPTGCPRDREQTHDSLLPDLKEETFEAIGAWKSGDIDGFVDELGDILFQVVFHSVIGREEGYFTFDDVTHGITEKMIRRHPHVFGGGTAPDWDALKDREKGVECFTDRLKDLKTLSGLERAGKIADKVKKIGFQWSEVSGILKKIPEETKEVEEAICDGDRDHIEEEVGDLLFTVANLCRFLALDPEETMEKACDKFVRRIGRMESLALKRQRDFTQLTLEELDALWNEVKSSRDSLQ